MKKFIVLTLFPNMFNDFIGTSIIKKALEKKAIAISIVDIRQYSLLKNHQVDDYQYGGGDGMVMMVEPIVKALRYYQNDKTKVVLLTPQGKKYSQQEAERFALTYEDVILICGHYEGFDERILYYVDYELSIGDYILTGGELASMIVIDSITRLCPGVINAESHRNDSFSQPMLDYPVYTKPTNFEDHIVPEVLLSGHHQNIRNWRDYEALKKTYLKRPDLLQNKELSGQEQEWLTKIKEEI